MRPDLRKYGAVCFQGAPNALYDRHLVFDYAIDPERASARERYEAVARSSAATRIVCIEEWS
jgi:hypothetical protein